VSRWTQAKWRIIDVPMDTGHVARALVDTGHVARAGHAPDVAVGHVTLGVTVSLQDIADPNGQYSSIRDCNGLPAKPPALDVMTDVPSFVLHVHLFVFSWF
jgi:hypothetical protein